MDQSTNKNAIPDIPKTVYKYRDWKNDFHKKVLTHFELFLSSSRNFNDPFDCKIPIAYWKLAEDSNLAERYFNQVVDRHMTHLNKEERLREKNRLLNDRKFANPQWIEEQEEAFFNSLEKAFGIISLTEVRDSIQMWSHYSNAHTGFCIGFKSEKLFFNEPRFGEGKKVDYKAKIPIISPEEEILDQFLKILYTKEIVWEYEQEYRLTKIHAANQVVHFKEDEVKEIILGCSISLEDERSILNICRCNFPSVPILKAVRVPREFKLDFYRIQ